MLTLSPQVLREEAEVWGGEEVQPDRASSVRVLELVRSKEFVLCWLTVSVSSWLQSAEAQVVREGKWSDRIAWQTRTGTPFSCAMDAYFPVETKTSCWELPSPLWVRGHEENKCVNWSAFQLWVNE